MLDLNCATSDGGEHCIESSLLGQVSAQFWRTTRLKSSLALWKTSVAQTAVHRLVVKESEERATRKALSMSVSAWKVFVGMQR